MDANTPWLQDYSVNYVRENSFRWLIGGRYQSMLQVTSNTHPALGV